MVGEAALRLKRRVGHGAGRRHRPRDTIRGPQVTSSREGDIVIDGGNSQVDRRQAATATLLAETGIGFVDCGVSGGVWGLDNGYALMAGGDARRTSWTSSSPIFDTLKPEGDFGLRTRRRSVGAGHFAKMVHNGIEYAIMQAYAEGWELMEASPIVENVPATMDSWREGTVIRSWLLDLAVAALKEDPDLEGIRGYAADSGEGRWTVQAAIDNAVPLPTITAALFARFASRQEDSPAMKMVAALRNQFGGHAVESAGADASASGVGSGDSVASNEA